MFFSPTRNQVVSTNGMLNASAIAVSFIQIRGEIACLRTMAPYAGRRVGRRRWARPGGDVADQRDVVHGPPLDARARGGVVRDLDGARLRGVAAKEAAALERGEVGVHGRRRGEAHRLADLPHRWGIAPLALFGDDE